MKGANSQMLWVWGIALSIIDHIIQDNYQSSQLSINERALFEFTSKLGINSCIVGNQRLTTLLVEQYLLNRKVSKYLFDELHKREYSTRKACSQL